MNPYFVKDINIIPAKISDAVSFKKNGIFEGSVASIENKLRVAHEETGITLFTDKEKDILFKLSFKSDRKRNALIEIRRANDGKDPGRSFSQMLSDMVAYSFFVLNIYKLSCVVKVDDNELESALNDNGFIQEALLIDEIETDEGFDDAGLFYLLSTEYRKYNVAFVPYQKGVLAVCGGCDFVDRICFLKYGEKPDDDLIFRAAVRQGLTSDDGKLLARGSEEFDLDPAEYDFMPQEPVRAFLELKEYFVKKRASFDINVITGDATDFQQKVWNALKKIPYGTTCSYEDIALMLTNDDVKAAKKLTRAVGSACSENPVPVIIPCHRVIGKNGKLTGFSGGIENKSFLLDIELFGAVMPLY